MGWLEIALGAVAVVGFAFLVRQFRKGVDERLRRREHGEPEDSGWIW